MSSRPDYVLRYDDRETFNARRTLLAMLGAEAARQPGDALCLSVELIDAELADTIQTGDAGLRFCRLLMAASDLLPAIAGAAYLQGRTAALELGLQAPEEAGLQAITAGVSGLLDELEQAVRAAETGQSGTPG